jgi:hypothetical protein
MKIHSNTPDQLIIGFSPWLITLQLAGFVLSFLAAGVALLYAGWFAGLLLIFAGVGIGITAFSALVWHVRLRLDRPLNTVTIRTRTIKGVTETNHALPDLSGAILQTANSAKGKTLYRPALILRDDTQSIAPSFTNTPGLEHMVDMVNAWIQGGSGSL